MDQHIETSASDDQYIDWTMAHRPNFLSDSPICNGEECMRFESFPWVED